MQFIWVDPAFSGAFWGAFFSFGFYILGLSLPKIIKKVKLRLQKQKNLNKLYRLLLVERKSDTIFFDLIEIFKYELTEEILKGYIFDTGNQIQFENQFWEILVINTTLNAIFSIRNAKNISYTLKISRQEDNLNILFDFIQDLEIRCEQANIKLKMNKELEAAKKELMLQASKKNKK